MKPTEVAQSQEVPEATQALGVEQSKSETPSRIEAENLPSEVTEPKASISTSTARPPVTNGAPSAAKDLTNYIWAVALIALVLVVSAAAMLAAG